MSFKIKIEKDRIKFSAAHFTIFGPETAERLHGHNYYLSLEVEADHLDPLGFASDMKPLKDSAYALSQELDEYVLLPSKNEYLTLQISKTNIVCVWNGKNYSFPKEDVKILELTNITCENLAFWFWTKMKPQLPANIQRLTVSVKETHGQESSYSAKVDH